jgi:hypothetical protein
LRIYQKTFNISRNISNALKLLAGINAKMNELSGDMHLVAEHLVFEEIISIYPMGTHEIPLVSDFQIFQLLLFSEVIIEFSIFTF